MPTSLLHQHTHVYVGLQSMSKGMQIEVSLVTKPGGRYCVDHV